MSPEEATTDTRVRVVGSPQRTGRIVSNKPRLLDESWSVRVLFDDGTRSMLRLDLLELLPEQRDLISDIHGGQLEGPESLRRNILHEKLHGRLSEVMYSMDASDTMFFAYQFKPVVKLLESPTNSLLVADEVGLGKTIEAGLIWTELRAREGARNLLVVCPPHLVTKWRNELKRRFGVDARSADAATALEVLNDAKGGTTGGFALVCSYHALRPPKTRSDAEQSARGQLAEKLEEWGEGEEPFIDLLVMDEAAIMRNSESQTSKLGALLAPVTKYKVYLSATPLHTNSRNLYTLLRRLDPDTFPDEHTFNTILAANEPLVRLRQMIIAGAAGKEELLSQVDLAASSPLLEDSNLLADLRSRIDACDSLEDAKVRADLAYRSERVNLLSYVVTRTRKRDVDVNPVMREVNTVLVPINTHEEKLYEAVTQSVWDYSDSRDISSGFLTVMPQRMVTSSMAAACDSLMKGQVGTQELNPDFTGSSRAGKSGPLMSYLKSVLAGRFSPAEFRASDSKYDALLDALKAYWKEHPGSKVVLFAFFKPTLRYLNERLAADGIDTLMLTGDSVGDKQAIVDAFAKPDSAPILLSSEVGSEGLDLQFAGALVNYDLPWNPMVVEQRIGRIHRIGQKAERIVVINMVCQGTVDERIYDRLYDRLDLFQRTLGDLESVIGPLITGLTKDILTNRLNTEQQAEKIENAAVALEAKMKMEEELEGNASILAAYGDFVVNQIAAAHDRRDWITGADIEAYICMFFRRNFPAVRINGVDQESRLFVVELDSEALHEFDRYLSAQGLRGQTRLTDMESKRIRFDHRVFGETEQGVEVVHQSHPLVRFAGHHMRVNQIIQPVPVVAEVPTDARPSGVEPGLYAFVSQRWTVQGLRNYEKIHHQVVSLQDGVEVGDNAVAAAVVEIAAALGDACDNLPPAGDDMLVALGGQVDDLEFNADEQFHEFEARCKLENEERARIQMQGVDRFEERNLESLKRQLEVHRIRNRAPLVAATEGRIRKLHDKCELMRDKVGFKAETRGENVTIAAGLVQFN